MSVVLPLGPRQVRKANTVILACMLFEGLRLLAGQDALHNREGLQATDYLAAWQPLSAAGSCSRTRTPLCSVYMSAAEGAEDADTTGLYADASRAVCLQLACHRCALHSPLKVIVSDPSLSLLLQDDVRSLQHRQACLDISNLPDRVQCSPSVIGYSPLARLLV